MGLFNTLGFYDSLSTFLDHVDSQSFMRLNHRTTILSSPDPVRMLGLLAAH